MKHIWPILLTALFVLTASFFADSPVSAEAVLATCVVPTDKATIADATNDTNCDIIEILAGTYGERVTITRNLQLIGNLSSNTIIDGGQGGTVITIDDNLVVALRNITIQNGQANRGGGLYIGNGAEVSTDSVVLKNNTATTEGGHVYSEGGITLLNVIMDNGGADNGGAVYSASGTISLQNFTVQNNSAATNGGGIYGNGSVLLENGFVQNNTAGANGGGVFATGDVDLDDVNASGNRAALGGAVYTEEANTTVSNTASNKLTGNRASRGGAIFGFEGNVEISGTDVTFNVADDSGGAIYVSGTSAAVRSGQRALTIRFQDGLMQGNTANIGGGLEINGTASVVILNATLQANKARHGAGIDIAGGAPSLQVTNSTFLQNNATEAGGGQGGGIRANGQASITLSRVTFDDNDAATDGGAIAILNSGVSLSAFNSQFLNNSTFSGNGGGIYAKTNSLTLNKVAVAANSAGGSGGGLYLDGTNGQIVNSTFSGNSANAAGQGSAIFANALRADFSTIAFNTGTAAVWKGSSSDLFLNNTIVHNPAVANCGGSVSQIKGSSSIDSDGACTLQAGSGNLTSDPQLVATLADNGGNTLTHALTGTGSPAFNSGTNCLDVDQRDVSRSTPCDRGAFELSSTNPTQVSLGLSSAESDHNLLNLALFLLVGLIYLTKRSYFGRYKPITQPS